MQNQTREKEHGGMNSEQQITSMRSHRRKQFNCDVLNYTKSSVLGLQ